MPEDKNIYPNKEPEHIPEDLEENDYEEEYIEIPVDSEELETETNDNKDSQEYYKSRDDNSLVGEEKPKEEAEEGRISETSNKVKEGADKTKSLEKPRKEDNTSEIADRVRDGSRKIKNLEKSAKVPDSSKKIGKEATRLESSAARNAGRAAGQAGKLALQAAKQAGSWLIRYLFLGPPWIGWIALAVILAIALVFAIVIAISSLAGLLGKGPAQYPETESDRYNVTVVLALSNNPSAKSEAVIKEVTELKRKLEDAKRVASQKNLAGALQAIDEIISSLDEIIAVASNPEERGRLIEVVQEKLKNLESNYSQLFFPSTSGTCADLAPYIANRQFTGGPSAQRNLKLIVEGKKSNSAGQIWPASQDMCRALVMAFRAGYTIHTNTFSMGHRRHVMNRSAGPSAGPVSFHWCGAAIDINQVGFGSSGRQRASVGNPHAVSLVQFWRANSGPGGGELYIRELFAFTGSSLGPQVNMNRNKSTGRGIGGHGGHIHLAGRAEGAARACIGGR